MTWTPPKRIVTVDAVIFNGRGDLLLIERGFEPFIGQYALPGGIVEEDETVEDAVVREVQEETGAIWPDNAQLRLLRVFSQPGRDPRGPTLSVAFCGVLGDRVHLRAGDDARRVEWVSEWEKRPLAFDHNIIANEAWAALGLKRGPLKVEGDWQDVSEIQLSQRQRVTLKYLYQGVGANLPKTHRVMQLLRKKGLVDYQEMQLADEVIPHWTITTLGRAVIST